MRLLHYSSKPLGKIRSVQHVDKGFNDKTDGLWVSVEGPDDWLQFCRDNDFAAGRFGFVTEISLSESAKILLLKTAAQIDGFTKTYGESDAIHRCINWEAVRQDYQGIIIAPYCHARRMTRHTFWYYTWDCASGVIWDAAAIASVKQISPN